jgi:hypothetical protein
LSAVSTETVTGCPHCVRDTPTIRGLCPNCGYAKNGPGPASPTPGKARSLLWDDLDNVVQIGLLCVPGLALVGIAFIVESGVLIVVGIVVLVALCLLRLVVDDW